MIKYDKNVRLLKSLVDIASPSGYENKIAKFIETKLLSYLSPSNIEIDFHNNVIATIKGKTGKVIMIDAHQDMLGFLINNIDKMGYISLETIGGHDLSLLRGRKVLVLTKKRVLKGVIGSKPIHLIGDEADELPDQSTDLTLDLGIRKRRNIEALISIGDPVILQPEFDKLEGNYYTGSGFDDKAGCFMLLQMIKNIKSKHIVPNETLKFVFSSQEEVGCRGARESAYKFKPDLFIGVDVTFATDNPDVDEREVGRCVLGQGIAIYKGVNIHRPSVELITSIANKYKTKVQYLACGGSAGTNAKSVANMSGGIKILDIGIPLRNMHTPVEVINMKDLTNGAELLTKFVTSKRLKNVIEK